MAPLPSARGWAQCKVLKRLRRQSEGRDDRLSWQYGGRQGATGARPEAGSLAGKQRRGCSTGSETRRRQVRWRSGKRWDGRRLETNDRRTERQSLRAEAASPLAPGAGRRVHGSHCELTGRILAEDEKYCCAAKTLSASAFGRTSLWSPARGESTSLASPDPRPILAVSTRSAGTDADTLPPDGRLQRVPRCSPSASRQCTPAPSSSDCPGGPDGRPRHRRNHEEEDLHRGLWRCRQRRPRLPGPSAASPPGHWRAFHLCEGWRHDAGSARQLAPARGGSARSIAPATRRRAADRTRDADSRDRSHPRRRFARQIATGTRLGAKSHISGCRRDAPRQVTLLYSAPASADGRARGCTGSTVTASQGVAAMPGYPLAVVQWIERAPPKR